MGASLKQRQSGEAGLIPNIRIFENNYKLERMNDSWEDIAASGERSLKLEDEFRPNVLHQNDFCHGYRVARDSAASHSKGASCA
jgi:glycogen synthase